MSKTEYKNLEEGMPLAVAERTILRKVSDISRETWSDVAERVALGNALLSPDKSKIESEKQKLQDAIGKATLLLSGRHLQHGDKDQPKRNQEVFTNCSTAPASFLMFYLLLNGSGVGRSYDDDMMLVNWDYAPNLRCVLSDTHPDFDWSRHESSRDAKHKYGNSKDVMWHEVGDSREEWAKALELWENATFEKIHKDKLLILDFSKIRRKGSPIGGMQDRPASGPKELIDAFEKSAKLKGAGLAAWKQAMYVDHYFAECVLVGGARRAARMATKYWRDKNICDFITVKRPIELVGKTPEEIIEIKKTENPMGFLWSSNNSVTVDADFWAYVNGERNDNKELKAHALTVFNAVCEASYFDGTGEPGLINVDKLTQKDEGYKELLAGNYVGSKKFQVNEDTHLYLSKLAKRARSKQFTQITNPSLRAGTLVLTKEGPRQINKLENKNFEVYNLRGGYSKASCRLSSSNSELYKVKLQSGFEYFATKEHRWATYEGEKTTTQLKEGDKLPILKKAKVFNGTLGDYKDGFLIGWLLGDGWVTVRGDNGKNQFGYIVSEEKYNCGLGNKLMEYLVEKTGYSGGFQKRKKDDLKPWYEINTQNLVIEQFWKKFYSPTKDTGIPKELLEEASEDFIAGLVDAYGSSDGSFQLERFTFTSKNAKLLGDFSEIFGFYGVRTALRKTVFSDIVFPNGKNYNKEYTRYDLVISDLESKKFFAEKFKLSHPKKQNALDLVKEKVRKKGQEINYVEVVSVEKTDLKEPVWDITVYDSDNCFSLSHCVTHNCGEISLTTVGGFCVIADVVPFHADTLDGAEEVFRISTRALIRVNLMDSIYNKEVKRTNRIGVGITGIHEFAWKFFKLGFRDLIDEEKSKEFWLALARFNRAVKDEAEKYCKELQVSVPHTLTTIKPAGTTSKLFMLTEGWHLPSMREFLRWVQFRNEDPLIKEYKERGYPIQELKSYKGTTIVGFPTAPAITRLGMGEELVTAAEATPEEQYKWLMLGEKYWIHGTDEKGIPVKEQYGNQISYTLKYKPDVVSFEEFKDMMAKYQSKISCCSVMPQVDASAYEYQPEQPVSSEEYQKLISNIRLTKEDLDFAHVDCAAGACPIDFKK